MGKRLIQITGIILLLASLGINVALIQHRETVAESAPQAIISSKDGSKSSCDPVRNEDTPLKEYVSQLTTCGMPKAGIEALVRMNLEMEISKWVHTQYWTSTTVKDFQDRVAKVAEIRKSLVKAFGRRVEYEPALFDYSTNLV